MTNRRKDTEVSPASSLCESPVLFDGQAGVFEKRAGLPDDCCRDIAKKVLEIGEARPGDLILEVGSGTGQLGQWFEKPVRYAGFDLSLGMLEQFSRRVEVDSNSRLLIQADANARWPVADGVARVIFSSRTVHLLQQEHVALEVLRVASSAGATLILGRVEREPESVRTRMANEMTEQLRLRGFIGRRSERGNRKLFEYCFRHGAIAMDSISVTKWTATASPRQSLDSWRRLTHLGGIAVPASTRADVLSELEGWAKEEFGDLATGFETEETYVLKSLRLPRTDGK